MQPHQPEPRNCEPFADTIRHRQLHGSGPLDDQLNHKHECLGPTGPRLAPGSTTGMSCALRVWSRRSAFPPTVGGQHGLGLALCANAAHAQPLKNTLAFTSAQVGPALITMSMLSRPFFGKTRMPPTSPASGSGPSKTCQSLITVRTPSQWCLILRG